MCVSCPSNYSIFSIKVYRMVLSPDTQMGHCFYIFGVLHLSRIIERQGVQKINRIGPEFGTGLGRYR